MKIFKYFFECYFYQGMYVDDLDKLIQDFKTSEIYSYQLQFIRELHQIINTKNYALASRIIEKSSGKIFNLEQTERVVLFIYNRLIGESVILNTEGFYNNCKVVFCPVCCPDPEAVTTFSLIDKATVIDKNIQIYICKPCKFVWLTEDIRADNAQDYKKFMKTLGLKGLWKELSDIETL